MVKHKNLWLSSSIAALLVSGSAGASEIVTYRYNELGRLVASTVSGGPNDTIGTATCFDAAGNRDYDPNGNTPLTLVFVTSNSHVSAQVISSTTIQFIGPTPGNTSTLSYVIKNSLNATATGTVTYKTTGTASTCYQ